MKFIELLKKAFIDEYWACAWRTLRDDELLGMTDDSAVHEYQPVPVGAGYWSADPFLIERGGRSYLFCELMRKGTKRAAIGCAEIAGGSIARVRPVLKTEAHLSYPAVFEHKGCVYMLPETRAERNLTLWRAVDFPGKWECTATLLTDREIADATPWWDGRSWVLFLYEPDDEHNLRTLSTATLNPVAGTLGVIRERAVYTEKTGRPAGTPFRLGSRRIRPTQIGVRRYGEAIAYREMVINSRTFAERDCGRLSPDCVRVKGCRHILGIHTINRLGSIEVIDVLYRKFAPLRVFRRLLGGRGE